MSQSFFRFKQFVVHQQHCAMKVSTDACIFGAWAAAQFRYPAPDSVLDIGTGTGLLSLMLAQQLPATARIQALEIDPAAARQAQENINGSRWAQQISLEEISLQAFAESTDLQFDLIICNPPFFHRHLPARDGQRQLARHSSSLDKPTLAGALSGLLCPEGKACVLYPAQEWPSWQNEAVSAGLHLTSLLHIRPFAHKAANRICGLFSKAPTGTGTTEELIIYEADKQYTPKARQLLRDYYLAL